LDYYAGMGLALLTERQADQIAGVFSCYDRILIFGTLPNICFAKGDDLVPVATPGADL
jgi:hypothetical protein